MWAPEAGAEMEGLPLSETFLPARPLKESDPGHSMSARLMVPLPFVCKQNSPLVSGPRKQGRGLYALVSALNLGAFGAGPGICGRSRVDASS